MSYDSEEFKLLRRCLNEQTITDGETTRFKEKGEGIPSTALQNPADPDSTFRKKLNSKHKGYTANIVESVDTNGSVITDYSYDCNIHSDMNFAREYLDKQNSDKEVLIVSDGGYASHEIKQIAESENIQFVTTNMPGTKPDDLISKFDTEGISVTWCPNGKVPISSNFIEASRTIIAVFDTCSCSNCTHREICKPKYIKDGAKITLPISTVSRAKEIAFRSTDEFKNISRLRNGVETIPSLLRNKYHVDHMPVRGRIRTKFFFGCMIGAINFNKLYRFRQGSGNYACNPILTKDVS